MRMVVKKLPFGTVLYASNRLAWRSWLSKNHDKEREIWLVFYRKSSGKSRIPYNAAVEEALCYGWIDSTVRKVDEESFAQRFTPRKPNSQISEMNKQRIHKLIKQKKMTRSGLTAISHVYKPARKLAPFTTPPEILKAIKKDEQAWKNYQKMPENYKRIRIAFIISRKRHGIKEYRKSLDHFVKMTAKNKKFGYVKEMI